MGAPSTQVTERDCRILAFLAEHRIVLAAHVQALLGVSETVASRRLGALSRIGLVEHSKVLHGHPAWYQITRPGLAMIGSELPPPRLDLRCYRHDIGVAWAWLAAGRGAFGRPERIVSERAMRSRDGAAAAADRAAGGRGEIELGVGPEAGPPFGVRLGGVGPRGQVRRHYPDLLLIGRGGERVAIELELSVKWGRRLETILAGYGSEPHIAAVLYLAEKPGIRHEVRATAARLGISDRIHVKPVAWPPESQPAKVQGQAMTRAGARGREGTRGHPVSRPPLAPAR